jgi:hypothetical protein
LVGEPEQGDDGWISVSAVIVVAVLVVSLDDPALPVLGVGVVAVLASRVGAPAAHGRELVIGPNLALTGSLSALLWFRTERQVGAEARAGVFSEKGSSARATAVAAALLA